MSVIYHDKDKNFGYRLKDALPCFWNLAFFAEAVKPSDASPLGPRSRPIWYCIEKCIGDSVDVTNRRLA
jgi:hypothetical protein